LKNKGKILHLSKILQMSHEEHNHESPKRVYFGIPIAFAMAFWLVVFLCLKACDGGHQDECCGKECSKECMEHCKAEGKDCVKECEAAKEDEENKEGVTEEKKEGSEAKEGDEKPAEEKKEAEGHH